MLRQYLLSLLSTLFIFGCIATNVLANENEWRDIDGFNHSIALGNNRAVQVYVTDKQQPTIAIFTKAADSDQLTIYRYKLLQRTGGVIEVTQANGNVGENTETIQKQWAKKALSEASKELGIVVVAHVAKDPWVSPTPIAELLLNGVSVKLAYGTFLSTGMGQHREDAAYDYPVIDSISVAQTTIDFDYDPMATWVTTSYTHAKVSTK